MNPRIPHAWIREVAWGDFGTAVLALAAIAALRAGMAAAVPLAWAVTVVGTLDFLNALGQGVYLGVTNLPLGIVWQIAAVVVPPLFCAHVLAFMLLLRREGRKGERGR